jgi:hypothetical protein
MTKPRTLALSGAALAAVLLPLLAGCKDKGAPEAPTAPEAPAAPGTRPAGRSTPPPNVQIGLPGTARPKL